MANSRILTFIGALLHGAESRGLTEDETALVPVEMRASIDLSRVRIIDRAHNPFAIGKILVRRYDIYWPGAPQDFAVVQLSRQALLIHELAHVWQYATGRLTAFSYLSRRHNWRYRYAVYQGAVFDDYAVEAQADLVQDWFRVRQGHAPAYFTGESPSREWLEQTVDFSAPRLRRLG